MKKIISTSICLIFYFLIPLRVFGNCVEGNCENGYGKFISPEGRSYIGEWKQSAPNGKGVLSVSESTPWVKYIGGFKNDKRHGEGIFVDLGVVVKSCTLKLT